MKVSFIGLGIMGSRMALNLLKKGVELKVYNRTLSAADQLVKAGATLASSVVEAVKEADIVFSMLSTPEVVEQLVFGEEGFIHQMKPAALWVDSTTVNPSFSLSCHERAEATGIAFLDAPVAGSKPQAAGAELIFFVGGKEENLKKVEPLMEHMSKKVLHAGEKGKGSSLKMLVNAMLAQSMLVFVENLILGEKMGLDKGFLLNFLPNLAVAAPFTKFKAEMIRQNDYEVQFPLEWMQKDLELVSKTGYELDQPLFMTNLSKDLFALAKQNGLGRKDFSAIYQYFAEN
ncbi:MAG: NAD(P)-dependent oxidoreductase [Bacteroidota bacterium]